MRKLFKTFATFSRTERLGLLALSALLIVLIAVRATMHLWVHPASDPEKEKKMVAAWETFKRSQPIVKKADTSDKSEYVDASDDGTVPLPNIININTADSATLVRLKWIGPVSAAKIVARRTTKGPFTNVDQLLEVCSIPTATFKVLKKHLSIAD